MTAIATRCCIVGGGPAGMMLGLLLARAGIAAVVLEKHGDFLRDFRGDTIHPSTLEIMHELGMLDDFLALPHRKTPELAVWIGDRLYPAADFSHLPTRCGFIAMMPQWDFLDFLARRAAGFAGFDLRLNAEAVGLIEEGGRVAGVRATTPAGPLEVRADLVVGCDGRGSSVRALAGLAADELGAPMDVLWFRLARAASDPEGSTGRFARGRIFVLIDRGTHWQCGFVIPKGGIEAVRAAGIEAFRAEVARLAPFAAERIGEIADWDAVKLLSVRVDRLRRWHRDGLLCIGDAAHAMSPVGGVGVNLAVQDAVATANLLAGPLARGRPTERDLARVQRRREWPTRITQALQVGFQRRIVAPVLGGREELAPPWALRLLARWPRLRRLPGRLIGLGVRPEHIDRAAAIRR